MSKEITFMEYMDALNIVRQYQDQIERIHFDIMQKAKLLGKGDIVIYNCRSSTHFTLKKAYTLLDEPIFLRNKKIMVLIKDNQNRKQSLPITDFKIPPKY